MAAIAVGNPAGVEGTGRPSRPEQGGSCEQAGDEK
jgi:hypothetical protein